MYFILSKKKKEILYVYEEKEKQKKSVFPFSLIRNEKKFHQA